VRSCVRIAFSDFERLACSLHTACEEEAINFRRCWLFSPCCYFYCYLFWLFLLMFFWSSRMRIAYILLLFCGRLKSTAYGGSVNTGCAVIFISSNIASYFFFFISSIFYILVILSLLNRIY
jgi:hypothetical protein